MAIACAYCKGEHDLPVQVRQCWADNGEQEVPLADEIPYADPGDGVNFQPSDDAPPPQPSPPQVAARRQVSSPPVVSGFERGVAAAGAGPAELGRNCLVAASTSVPGPWADAERVVVDAAAVAEPTGLLATLRAAADLRQRLIIELAVDFDREPMLKTDAQPFEMGADFVFELEALHHAVWSNAVDVREDRCAWVALDRAIAAGATAAASDQLGDIVAPDGTQLWLDGGPIRHTDPIDGVAVVHNVAVEHRSFAAPGNNVSEADLAPDQLAAVTHSGGAARIIAPAGSGKTRVLTERARHLLRTWNLPASAVILVAFNKRAQEEMVERTPDLPGLQVRTLNAMALAIVNGTRSVCPRSRHDGTRSTKLMFGGSSATSCRFRVAATATPSPPGSRRSA